jgi:hypothetical protein
MNTIAKRLSSLSGPESEDFNNKKNKFELVSCSVENMKCTEHLFVINKNYHELDTFLRDKDFRRSIEKLESAFYKTMEFRDVQCMKCMDFFRATITDSLRGIKKELEKMTTGFFGNKHYMPSYILANNTLQELEKLQLCNTEQFMGSYLEKKVS